jgi:hypothetical protein
MKRRLEVAPRRYARIAGALYLFSIIARIVADGFVRDRLIVATDASATATNILAHEPLFRLGFVAEMLALAAFLAVVALLYELLKPVNRSVSIMAAFFGLASCITHALSGAFHLAALFVLGSPDYLRVFSIEQQQSLALLLLKLRAVIFHNVGLVFLGLYAIAAGYLITRAAFLPKAVGVLFALGGLAYLPFLYPPLAGSLLPYLLIPVGIGQIALALWLLVMGVNAERWVALAADAD